LTTFACIVGSQQHGHHMPETHICYNTFGYTTLTLYSY